MAFSGLYRHNRARRSESGVIQKTWIGQESLNLLTLLAEIVRPEIARIFSQNIVLFFRGTWIGQESLSLFDLTCMIENLESPTYSHKTCSPTHCFMDTRARLSTSRKASICLRASIPVATEAAQSLSRNREKKKSQKALFHFLLRDLESNQGLQVMSLTRYLSSIPLCNFTTTSSGYESTMIRGSHCFLSRYILLPALASQLMSLS